MPSWAVIDHELTFYDEASFPFPIYNYVELYDYAKEVLSNMRVNDAGVVEILDPTKPFDLGTPIPREIPYGTVWDYHRNDIMPQGQLSSPKLLGNSGLRISCTLSYGRCAVCK